MIKKLPPVVPTEYSYALDTKAIQRIKSLLQKKESLEVDFFITPATVASDDIPYHGYMLLVVDAGGFVTGGEMLVANPDLQTMYESVPEKLLDILIEKNKRPGKIRVESQKLFSLLLPLAKRLDIRVELTEKFTYLNQAKKGLIDHLKNMPG